MIKNAQAGTVPNRAPLLVGLGLGLVAAVLIAVYLIGARNDAGVKISSGEGKPVVVVAQDVGPGVRLTPEMLAVKTFRESDVLAGAFTTAEGVVNQVTTVPLVTGEQVSPTKLTSTTFDPATFEGDLPLSVTIPQGRRAFSLLISEVGAAGGLVRAGDYVDVIFSEELSAAADPSSTQGRACYVAQDLQVLAIGQVVLNQLASSEDPGDGPGAAETKPTALSATLAVTPPEAANLAAQQRELNGSQVKRQLWLSLRPLGERGPVGDLPVCP